MYLSLFGLTDEIPSEYEIFSGYLLEKSSARDYDLREKVAEQVIPLASLANSVKFRAVKVRESTPVRLQNRKNFALSVRESGK